MRKALVWGVCGSALVSAAARATVIGTEDFAYPDGPIANQTGGTGWVNERTDEVGAAPSTVSDWDNVGGTPGVVSGALVTQSTSAKREYNGPSEGSTNPSNEREGAFRGAGRVFYRSTMTRAAGADWSGMSSYDFAAERIFFGVPGGQPGPRFFGIEQSGVGTTLSTVPVVEGQAHTVVTMLDFDTDTLALWVDPQPGDLPDATRAYALTNWSTAVRLGSGGSAATTWDNLVVATESSEVGGVAIPEPSALGVLVLCGIPVLMRRRRA